MPGEIAIDHEDYYPFQFEADIEYHHLGSYRYTVVFLDERLHGCLPLAEHPRLRTSGELRDIPFDGAWQPVRGRWYLMLSKPQMRAGAFEVGDRVQVRFRIEDQDAVEVPAELRLMLEGRPRLERVWGGLTAGKRRGLAHRVASAKTAPTRERRLAEVAATLADADADADDR
ncbi:MAG: YdeI/OmpD-associated family protein [Acidobacteriota bacterium]